MLTRRTPLVVLVTVVLSGFPTFGQRSVGPYKDTKGLPDVPAATRLTELLEVLRSGKSERIRALVTEGFAAEFLAMAPVDEHVAILTDSIERASTYELYGSRQYDPPRPETTVTAIFRDTLMDSWEAIVISVEPNPPHKIAGLQFAPARPPSDLPPAPKRSDAEVVAELGKFLDRLAQADQFSGTVLLAKNGEVLFKKAYGQACKSFDAANTIDTKFNLGSMNKMFTAVAIGQLVEKGKLSFTDPIGKYLRLDWLDAETSGKIIVEHLLSHTSGLGSYFNDEFMRSSRTRFRTVDDYKPLVVTTKLKFEPGTQWAYSNTGFLLLGAIIEKVTGGSYHDYIRQNVTGPAGMVNTDCYDMDLSVPNLALGYMREKNPDGSVRWRTNIFEHVCKGGPAGGGYSTVEDLLKFDQALRAGKLVSASTREQLWSAKPNSPDYGYGFGLGGAAGNRVVGHSGGFPGINGTLGMHLDTGYTVAALSNYDRGASIVEQKINELLGVGR